MLLDFFSGMDYYPPGGFMSFFQSGQPLFPHVSAQQPKRHNKKAKCSGGFNGKFWFKFTNA